MKTMSSLFVILFCANSLNAQNEIKSGELKSHVSFLANDSLLGRGWTTDEGLQAAHYIADEMLAVGVEPWEGEFLHAFYTRMNTTMLKGHNVIGLVRGSQPGYIVIGAHYDHISYKLYYSASGKRDSVVVYNGADDNASGVATILELGERLVKNKQKLGRSVILVAFDAEESGLIGSSRIVKDSVIPIEEVELMVSVDMVGHYDDTQSIIMGALNTFEGGEELIQPIATFHDIELKGTSKQVSSRTDSKYFGMAGIPALYVTTGIVGPYHKPQDDIDSIDFVGMAKVDNFLLDATYAISSKDSIVPTKEFEAWASKKMANSRDKKKGRFVEPTFRYGLKVNLGSGRLNYKDEFFESKKGVNIDAGLTVQLKLMDHISLRTDALYASFGSQYENGDLRLHSLCVPVHVMLTSKRKRGNTPRVFCMVGAYYNYIFAGKEGGVTIDLTDDFTESQFGLSCGVGFDVSDVVVGLEFRYSFDDMTSAPETIKQQSLMFSLGHWF